MNKPEIIRALRQELMTQYERAVAAARDARGYATDKDSKAESKYDTRSLEASYLAVGHAAKSDELAAALAAFTPRVFRPYEPDEAADLGALVLVAYPDRTRTAILLAPSGGGLATEVSGLKVLVVTPGAPLYGKLLGKRPGERLMAPEMELVEVL